MRCASTCATTCCSFGGRLPATASRLANSGARLSCSVAAVCAAAVTAARSSGVSTFFVWGMLTGVFAAALASASGASVMLSGLRPDPAPESGPTTASLMPPSVVCDTASCKLWPADSGTSESTSIDKFAMAIRTRLSERSFSTSASTTVPGRSTSSGAALCAAVTGSTGLTEIDMFAVSLDCERYLSVVNLSLTGRERDFTPTPSCVAGSRCGNLNWRMSLSPNLDSSGQVWGRLSRIMRYGFSDLRMSAAALKSISRAARRAATSSSTPHFSMFQSSSTWAAAQT